MAFQMSGDVTLRFCGGFARWRNPAFENAARTCELGPGAVRAKVHVSTDGEQLGSQLRIAEELCGGPSRQSNRQGFVSCNSNQFIHHILHYIGSDFAVVHE